MRTAPMCYSILRVPRCRVYSLVNTWWAGFVPISPTCKKSNFRLLSSSVGGHERNSGSWSRRPLITADEETSKNSLSSAVNIRHDLSDNLIATTSTDFPINITDGSSADVRQLIAENKELSSLATFIVFDLETTGFSRTVERIIEIALQDLHGGENSTFHTLINPGRDVGNEFIHGISTQMVSKPGVPRMEELIPILLKYVQSRQKPGGYVVLVAHNARNFDVPFLVAEFRRCGFEIPSNWYFVDTLPLSKEAMKSAGKTGSKTLKALQEHFGISQVGEAHRAMSDVHSLSLVLQKLTFVLELPIAGLVQRAFTVDELTSSSTKKKKK
ncbi:exonuclease DPD1, chloroplastic/mitochondrial-like [Chenopodium quinoa]|uniref:exonuclease DPD1, chloroplastic/mitochondrial-like n=1 Tax=Chenopodium quinoa TaxID=63459 RepID=UPI000B774DF1|nr:exonuclease DPD1, chloroplastic/mitochondrial-like [Chenopodium quinoa]XP_021742635.1 exonuclease DPD1, chloroplastic/mitochondrial-like [Chenopodium quinoa]